jgi:2,3-dihydroxyphenylpropionate 1,2-dioxygenase
MLLHAPQFFTMPETEDRATVARVKEVRTRSAATSRRWSRNLWIIFA